MLMTPTQPQMRTMSSESLEATWAMYLIMRFLYSATGGAPSQVRDCTAAKRTAAHGSPTFVHLGSNVAYNSVSRTSPEAPCFRSLAIYPKDRAAAVRTYQGW